MLPRFKRLADHSGKLAEDLARACDGNKKAAAAVKKDFADTVLAWAAVEFLRFGPMSQIGRPERFDFSPDPRGVTQRQVGALVAKRDASALDPATLAKKSAAVQGLSALEVLLYDDARPITGDDEEARYRCKLALAMAQSTTRWRARFWRSGRAMLAGAGAWSSPGRSDARYKSPEEPAGDFARALITGLQMIQDREVVADDRRGGDPRQAAAPAVRALGPQRALHCLGHRLRQGAVRDDGPGRAASPATRPGCRAGSPRRSRG